MDIIKFRSAQQAEGLALSAFWSESLRHDHQRLYILQSRLAVLRIRRRARNIHDRAQARTLLQMCRLARATLCQSHARARQASAGRLA